MLFDIFSWLHIGEGGIVKESMSKRQKTLAYRPTMLNIKSNGPGFVSVRGDSLLLKDVFNLSEVTTKSDLILAFFQ